MESPLGAGAQSSAIGALWTLCKDTEVWKLRAKIAVTAQIRPSYKADVRAHTGLTRSHTCN